MSTAVLPTKKQEYTKPIKKSQAKKRWAWLWARGASQNLGFPFNIYTVAESRDFKFGTQLGFAKAQYKTTLRGKMGLVLSFGKPQLFAKFEVAENIREFVFKRQIPFLSHPMGELGVTTDFIYSSLESA